MRGVLAWAQLDLRGRWRSVIALSLLVAFGTGTVMTAVAGARRGATSVGRLVAQTAPATIVVLPNEAGFDWQAVRALPGVEALAAFPLASYALPETDPVSPESASFAFIGDEIMRTIERPVVFEGRVPHPARDDEVVITPSFAGSFGKSVGDSIDIHLYTPDQVESYAGGQQPGPAAGPDIQATIVGIIRSPWFSDAPGSRGMVVPSPGLFYNRRANFMGTNDSTYINALVRLRNGDSDLSSFKAGLARISGRPDIEVWSRSDLERHARDVTDFEARSLLAFALAAAIAALFLVGQAIARHTAATAVDLDVLRAIGVTRREARLAAVISPTLAAIVGGLLAAAGAAVSARWFPIGTAALIEPAPGYDADVLVLGIGVVGVPLLVALASLVVADLALGEQGTAQPTSSRVVAAAVRMRLPVAVVVGARFAFESRPGRQSVPTRPAIFGAVVGVLGTVAALTFSAGVDDASTNLERFGHTYELNAFLGMNSEDFASATEVLTAAAADPAVAGVTDAKENVAQAGDVAVDVYSYARVGNPVRVVMVEGRMPTSEDEIALGPRTAKQLGAETGDEVDLAGNRSERRLRVTGLAFVPSGPHNDYATGAWTTDEGYDALFEGFKFHLGLVAVDEGAKATDVAARVLESGGPELSPLAPPSEIAELRQVRSIPMFLAAFLALLALAAVGHALATAVRRRRHDVAVLHALGFTRSQSRAVVITQATLLAVVGVVAGVPLGLVLGRTVWRSVATSTPVAYVPPVAWLATLLLIPIALVAANLLAAWPLVRVSRLKVHEVLRTE